MLYCIFTTRVLERGAVELHIFPSCYNLLSTVISVCLSIHSLEPFRLRVDSFFFFKAKMSPTNWETHAPEHSVLGKIRGYHGEFLREARDKSHTRFSEKTRLWSQSSWFYSILEGSHSLRVFAAQKCPHGCDGICRHYTLNHSKSLNHILLCASHRPCDIFYKIKF